MSERITSCQPSTRTNKSNFRGRATIVGGIIIMPMDISVEATKKSITRKGIKIRNPIWNEVLNSLMTNAGRTTLMGRSLTSVRPMPARSKKKSTSPGRVCRSMKVRRGSIAKSMASFELICSAM